MKDQKTIDKTLINQTFEILKDYYRKRPLNVVVTSVNHQLYFDHSFTNLSLLAA